ncbi:hypothetical protein SSS_03873 [Sarcoptes scabiei]|uniref:Uncharacterized protein n=2 Tax=Sarcoptes scabiei TaxID=52283 RepID=A0A834VAH6_SARSC|nr:hypothetical protein SSS_03873 [Sarcoptes scabiei]
MMITQSLINYHLCVILFVSSVITFILMVVICVCHPKSRRFRKHRSFILSHDLAFNDTVDELNQNIDCVSQTNDTESILIENHQNTQFDSKIKPNSLNRALPNIPQTSSDTDIIDGSNIFCNNDDAKNQVFSNDRNQIEDGSKIDVDNVSNHAYARIRNVMNDSYLENDTDDYFDATPAVSCSNKLKSSPSHTEQINSSREPFHPAHSPQPPLNIDNLPSNDIIESIEPKKEISYNTISVREPLAKVLAERDKLEHHYNEVEEERLSSFYEEIVSGSVTYSKIDDTRRQNIEPIPSSSNDTAQSQLPLYSLIGKKKKSSHNDNVSNVSSIDVIDNLYTKIMKPKNENNNILLRYSPPPPLPPPLNKETKIQSKAIQNVIKFGTSSVFQDQDQNLNQNHLSDIYRQISERDPGYETVYKEIDKNDDDQNLSDYGYEAIVNDTTYEVVLTDNSYETIQNHNLNSDNDALIDDQADPNYEIISNIKIENYNRTPVTNANNSSNLIRINNNQIIDENTQDTSDLNQNLHFYPKLPPSMSSDENFVIIEHL